MPLVQRTALALLLVSALRAQDCQSEPKIRTTEAGVKFVRTPENCFKVVRDFPYKPKYVAIDGLRQAYIDEGPRNADPILLLHGEPSWSYLYRKMIPVLVAKGHRVIAMDHLGMGRSDKPVEIAYYTYLGHAGRLEKFIQELKLEHITLFCQDWGSLIGLRVAGEHPDWFARIVVGDGALPVFPAGMKPFSAPKDPDVIDESIPSPFANIPAQQVPFYDADGRLLPGVAAADFAKWMNYAMKSPKFRASEVLEALTWFPLSERTKAAYDAPFPRREYMAGARAFPSIVNQLGGTNLKAWDGLRHFEKPFLTIWSANDPANLGTKAMQQNLIDNVPGARGQPHARLAEASHFLQGDQGAEIARRVNQFIEKNPR